VLGKTFQYHSQHSSIHPSIHIYMPHTYTHIYILYPSFVVTVPNIPPRCFRYLPKS
jgi:hypothetical protein